MSEPRRDLFKSDDRGGKRVKMVLHGFTSDLPSKSLFPKRLRRNLERLRRNYGRLRMILYQKESQVRLRLCMEPSPAIVEVNKYLGLPIQATPSWVPFSFTLPDWPSTWQALYEKWLLAQATKHAKCRRIPTTGEICDDLPFAMDKLSFSDDFTAKTLTIPLHDTLDMKEKSSSPFRIMKLPREIRDLIYSFALLNTTIDDTGTPQWAPIHIFFDRRSRMFLSRVSASVSALLSASHLILAEGLPIFYRINSFYIRGVKSSRQLSQLDPIAFRNIQKLDLYLAKATPVLSGLFPILHKTAQLPRLRTAEIRILTTFDLGKMYPQGYCYSCGKCLEPGCAVAFHKQLIDYSCGYGLSFKMEYCSPKEKSTCNPVAPSCSVCAAMEMTDHVQHVETAKTDTTSETFTRPPIDVHVCRSDPTDSSPNYEDPLISTATLPSCCSFILPPLQDPRNIRRALGPLKCP